jgi:hypothetical protein
MTTPIENTLIPSLLNRDDDDESRLDKWLRLYGPREDMPEEDRKKAETLCAAIREAAAKYGEDEIEVLALSKPKGAVAVFRAPSAPEYQRFMGGILHDSHETKAKAAGLMARAVVVYPSKVEFGSWCDRYGGIGNACLKPLSRLAGAELADRGKE